MSISRAMSKRIDTHAHIVPPMFASAVSKAGGDPSGWHMPAWTKESALAAADANGVEMSVVSVTSPGTGIAGLGQGGRKLTRECNEWTHNFVSENKDRFRFFASTPNWEDVEGTVKEIEWVYRESNAVGIVAMTSYGDRLLGDPLFDPIWEKLNSYNAVVFVHPTSLQVKPQYIAGFLPGPVVDYPLATTRTAVDIVCTKVFRRFPNVNIILSHLGGTLPFLFERTSLVAGLPEIQTRTGLTMDDIVSDLKKFYIDTALGTSSAQLDGLLHYTTPDKLLFGTDFPYAPDAIIEKYSAQLDAFLESEKGRAWAGANNENAKRLLSERL